MAQKTTNPNACAHDWQVKPKGRLYCSLCRSSPCPGYNKPDCPTLIPNGQKRCPPCRQRRKEVRRERKNAAQAAFHAAIRAQAAQEGYDLLENRGTAACNITQCDRLVKTAGQSHPLGLCARCLPLAFPEYAAALARIAQIQPPPLPGPEPGPTQDWLARRKSGIPVCPAFRQDGDRCQARPNSRGYCGVHRSQAPETCNLKELKARGWTPARIRQILGEPDLLGTNPIYKTAAPTRLYLTERVQAAEAEQAAASPPPPPGLPAGQKPLLPDFPPTPNS